MTSVAIEFFTRFTVIWGSREIIYVQKHFESRIAKSSVNLFVFKEF